MRGKTDTEIPSSTATSDTLVNIGISITYSCNENFHLFMLYHYTAPDLDNLTICNTQKYDRHI